MATITIGNYGNYGNLWQWQFLGNGNFGTNSGITIHFGQFSIEGSSFASHMPAKLGTRAVLLP